MSHNEWDDVSQMRCIYCSFFEAAEKVEQRESLKLVLAQTENQKLC